MHKGRRSRSETVSSYMGRERDDVEVLQTGLLNLGNSCFYNTILQSLSVTRPLAALIAAPPSTSPALLALSPASFTYNPDPTTLLSPLPISQALLTLLSNLSPPNNDKLPSKKPFNPKALLRELAKKHEEYAQATQQDSHELLRHLIDGVFMEEVDLIKKLTVVPVPATISSSKKRRRMTLRAAEPAPPLRPTMYLSRPSDEPPKLGDQGEANLPEEDVDDADDEEDEETEESSGGSGSSSDSSESEDEQEKEKKEKPRPFIDSVFGGKLASVVICDECQHVSLTHEDFLDLSLSLKDDAGNRMRKRDRIKRSLQAGFFSKKAEPSKPTSLSLPLRREPIISLSETEASASASEAEPDEDLPYTDSDALPISSSGNKVSRRKSLDPSHLRESRKPFWSTNSNGSKPGSSSRDPSPLTRTLSVLSGSSRPASHKHKHKILKPSLEHAAYVRKILATIPGPSSSPLTTQLRWAQPNKAGAQVTATQALSKLQLQSKVAVVPSTDLYECFVNFTAVEVLEGDNLYSCKQCWKLLNPEMVHRRRIAKEDRQQERRAKKRASASNVGDCLDDAASAGTPHPTSIASPGAPPFLEFSAGEQEATAIPRSPTSSTSGDAHMDEGRAELRLADAEDGSATDTSIETTSSTKLPLTKANVLALTPAAANDAGTSPISGTTSATSATTATTASLNRAPSAASLSARLSTSTRFSLPVATPPRAARHVLRRAHKRYLISAPDLPPVLVIHLKRFQQTSQSSLFGNAFMNLKKRDDFLSFPEEMDLTPFLAPLETPPRATSERAGAAAVDEKHAAHHHRHWPGQRPQGPADEFIVGTARYRLYAVVVHHGNLREGHYTSYVLSDRYRDKTGKGAPVVDAEEGKEETRRERKWFFCSDELVRLCTLEEVLRSKAYMLFYERVPNVESWGDPVK